ncbi:MAG TPA: hypothetical protein VL991_12235 [Terracidiphilus sp.]|nr:hypothetical protein [Terracidiphilus sp.]
MAPLNGTSTSTTVPAVTGTNNIGDGVSGTGRRGVVGISPTYQGVYGQSTENAGVVGESTQLHGVFGVCHNPHGAGCYGTNDVGGFGIQGVSTNGDGVTGTGRRGVVGISPTYQGVYGQSTENAGVVGESTQLHGIFGVCHNPNGAGVYGTNDAGGFGLQGFSANGIGVTGKGGKLAAFFDGPIQVNGDIRLSNGDCAEEFDILEGDDVLPGMVMVLTDSGALRACTGPYDKRAAGVVTGAGEFRPALILDRQERRNRMAIGVVGKVSCRVDASYAPIEAGDLLTTSGTYGCAMKALDPHQAFGAVIGKALRALRSGEGLIPMLIALQ